jgi:glucokinase
MARKANDGLVLGVDLGGTKTLVGVVDAENRVLGRGKLTTPARQGGDAIVETIAQEAKVFQRFNCWALVRPGRWMWSMA